MYAEKPWLQFYEDEVPEEISYDGQLVHDRLQAAALQYPNNTAVRMLLKYLPLGLAIQSKMTYRDLVDASDRFAAALRTMGVQQGERVAVMLPNSAQQVVAFYGILKAGCTVVNTNPTYTSRELHHQLKDSQATTILLLSGLYERLEQIQAETAVKNVIVTDISDPIGFPFKPLVARQLRKSGAMADVAEGQGIFRYNNLLKENQPQPPEFEAKPDDVVLFQYTGGTTGIPKAAMLTHKNLMCNVLQMEAWFTNLEHGKETTLGAVPGFHVYGMTVSMLLTIHAASELVVIPDPRQTEQILQIIDREKVTLYPGIPTMYTAINNHPKVGEYDLRTVKACLSGAMALPVEIQERFEELSGGRLVEGYGLTETSPVVTANPINGRRKEGSIGLPMPSTEVAVVSLEQNEDGSYDLVEPGNRGELVVRGPQVMKGYWNNDEETAQAIDQEGWFHSGDIVTMDDEGYFYIVDRKKDLIIASGYSVVPREVEEVLTMHAKVQEAAVIGVPHERRGETVKAYIVLREDANATEDEIRGFCKDNLAPYKVPKMIEFRSELPRSQIGKVLRRVLLEEEEEKQKQKEAA